MELHRIAILSQDSNGVASNTISQQLQISDKPVWAVVRGFVELGAGENRPRSERSISNIILRAQKL